jgi:type II secretory pathway pseudopilin PulG
MTYRPLHSRSEQGFSLLEMIIGLGLAAVVFGVLVSFFLDFGRSSTTQNAAAEAQQNARAGLDFVVRELRLAGLDPFQSSGAGIEAISSTGTSIRFTADFCNEPIGNSCGAQPEPDGSVDGAGERITYLYDAGQRELRRMLYEGTPSEAWTTLVSGVVSNPNNVKLFTFVDGNGNEITDNANRGLIRAVVVTLTVEEPAGRAGTVTRTYTSRVRLRNIGI